jgi:hypothetical protein
MIHGDKRLDLKQVEGEVDPAEDFGELRRAHLFPSLHRSITATRVRTNIPLISPGLGLDGRLGFFNTALCRNALNGHFLGFLSPFRLSQRKLLLRLRQPAEQN